MTPRSCSGFTLLEMLAVVALTTLVLTVAINFFIDLSHASNDATDRMRAARRATALADRLARDLEGAVLVKKPKETDPLDHPWLFLAESGGGGSGADRIKFMTRSASSRTSDEHDGDVTVVAYAARPAADGGIEIVRSSEPRLPGQLDRTIPLDGEGAMVLASGIASFAVRLLDETGAWQTAWDSSQLTETSELPLGAEIEISMLPPSGATPALATTAGAAPEPSAIGPFRRRVLIPMRPLDLEALLNPDQADETPASEGDEEDEKDDSGGDSAQQASAEKKKDDDACMTVAQCLALNPGVAQQYPQALGLLSAIGGQCFRDIAAHLPAGISLVGCQ